MASRLIKRKFSADDFERMVEAGILGPEDRVELVEGEVVEMAPIGSRHAACVKRLNRLLGGLLGDRALLGIQDPVRLDAYTQLQPDVAVLRPRADFYAAAHPGPEDVWLVIEVTDSTEGHDRAVKVPLYARAGIPELWLVDLPREVIEVYRQPTAEGYATIEVRGRDERVECEHLGLTLRSDDVLG